LLKVLLRKELWTLREFEDQRSFFNTDIIETRFPHIVKWHLHFEAVFLGKDEPYKTPFSLADPSHEVLLVCAIDSVPFADIEHRAGNSGYGIYRM